MVTSLSKRPSRAEGPPRGDASNCCSDNKKQTAQLHKRLPGKEVSNPSRGTLPAASRPRVYVKLRRGGRAAGFAAGRGGGAGGGAAGRAFLLAPLRAPAARSRVAAGRAAAGRLVAPRGGAAPRPQRPARCRPAPRRPGRSPAPPGPPRRAPAACRLLSAAARTKVGCSTRRSGGGTSYFWRVGFPVHDWLT